METTRRKYFYVVVLALFTVFASCSKDGTFVGELYPTYFEYNLLEYRALDDPSYKDKAPADVRQAAQNICLPKRYFLTVIGLHFTFSPVL